MGFLRLALSGPILAKTMKQRASEASQPSPRERAKQLGCEFDLGIKFRKSKKAFLYLGEKKLTPPTTQHNEVMDVSTPTFF